MSPLTSFCQPDSSLRVRVALMTLYNTRHSDWSEMLIVMLEYLQLLSQGFLLNLSISDDQASTHSDFPKGVVYFFKLVNPSSLISFGADVPLTITIMAIFFLCMLFKFFLSFYIVYIAYKNRNGNNCLLTLSRWIFRAQGRVICFFITSFWTNIIISSSTGSFQIKGVGTGVIIATSSIYIVLEYAFSFILEAQFCYMLPMKNFLASKGYSPQVGTLIQKLSLQVLQMALYGNFDVGRWVFSSLNLFSSIVRNYRYYTILPLYNFKALFFQGSLLNLVISLNLACFVQNMAQASDYEGSAVDFTVIVWIILSLLSIKLSQELLHRRKLSLVITRTKGQADLLLHKVSAIKQLRKDLKKPSDCNNKYDVTYLLSAARDTNIQDIFNLSSEACSSLALNLYKVKDANRIFLKYFQNLSTKFPDNAIIKLYIAKLCTKDPELYSKAIAIITKMKQKIWSQSYLTASLLLYKIEKAIVASHKSAETQLDLLTYIKNQIYVDELRKEMLNQAELKITICNNILGEISNIGQIFNCSQLVDKSKVQLQRKIDTLYENIPSYFIEPHLLCAGYALVLQYSLGDYDKYNEFYYQKLSKYEKSFQEPDFTQENIYQETNAFLILSGEKGNNSQIVFCSSSIENVCGGKQASYNGSEVSKLFMPSFQPFYSNGFRKVFDIGTGISLNQGERVFLHHKEGYMLEAEIYLKIHPYLAGGLYLDMMIRPIPSAKEYMIIQEDGSIEGATRMLASSLAIRKSLGSSTTLPNIKQISEELWRVNQAFNTVAKNQTYDKAGDQDSTKFHTSQSIPLNNVNYEKALNLYNAFSSGTKRVHLAPIKQTIRESYYNRDDMHYYDCSVSMLPFGPLYGKLLTFERAAEEEVDHDYEGEIVETRNFREHTEAQEEDIEEQEKEDNPDGISFLDSENIDSPEKVEEIEAVKKWKQENNLTTHEYLLTPTSQAYTKAPLLLSGRIENKTIQNNHVKPQPSPRVPVSKRENKDLPFQMNMGSMNFQHPTSSRGKTSVTTFRSAIKISFYPKSFGAICVMFYTVIFITLLSQIILKVASDEMMASLTLKKTLLTYFQLRTFKSFFIAANSRAGVSKIVEKTIDNAIIPPLPIIVAIAKTYTADLKSFNKKIMNYTSSLDEDVQRKVYAQDVQMYNYQVDDLAKSTSKNISQFEVISEVLETISKLQTLPDPDSPAGLSMFYFIRYNILNNFLYKCGEIKNLFIETVQNEKELLELIITLCLVIIPILLIGIILMVTAIIWKQYKIEKKNMLAFIRLKPEKVKEILAKIKNFKKNLQNQDYREYKEQVDENPQVVFPADKQQEGSNPRKRDDKIVNYSETRARYYKYFVRVTFYTLILVALMIWNFLSAQSSNKIVYRKQSQIEFAQKIAEIVGTQYVSVEDTFLTNNTMPIKHLPPYTVLTQGMAELINLQSQIAEMFLEADRTYDPDIQPLIFNSSCDQFNFSYSVSAKNYCKALVARGQLVTPISLMATYQDIVQTKYRDYVTCDKSNMTFLFACVYKNVEIFLPTFSVLSSEALAITDIISAKLEQSVINANKNRNLFLIIFAVSLAVASLLIWFQILVRLREGYNDFKKVLLVFPPRLILSSPLLKAFLLHHSNIRRDASPHY